MDAWHSRQARKIRLRNNPPNGRFRRRPEAHSQLHFAWPEKNDRKIRGTGNRIVRDNFARSASDWSRYAARIFLGLRWKAAVSKVVGIISDTHGLLRPE